MNTIDLSPFCGKDDVREYINAPFSILGGTGASNGHILVWIDKETSSKAYGARESASVERLITKAQADGAEAGAQWLAVDTIRTSSRICTLCDGTGVVRVIDCEDCDGDGEFWHGNHTYDCKECDGAGHKNNTGIGERCDECGGTGNSEISQPSSYGSDGFTVASHFITLIRKLPACRIKPYDHSSSGIPFVFDGGVGIVMPMRKDPIA